MTKLNLIVQKKKRRTVAGTVCIEENDLHVWERCGTRLYTLRSLVKICFRIPMFHEAQDSAQQSDRTVHRFGP